MLAREPRHQEWQISDIQSRKCYSSKPLRRDPDTLGNVYQPTLHVFLMRTYFGTTRDLASCAHVYHIGAIHVGCAFAAIMWSIIFSVGASIELGKDADLRAISLAPTMVAYFITFLLLLMTLMSVPELRSKYHDVWEYLHRFGGWAVLIFYWVFVSLSTKDLARGSDISTNASLCTKSIHLAPHNCHHRNNLPLVIPAESPRSAGVSLLPRYPLTLRFPHSSKQRNSTRSTPPPRLARIRHNARY
jgi:hypothetical protein